MAQDTGPARTPVRERVRIIQQRILDHLSLPENAEVRMTPQEWILMVDPDNNRPVHIAELVFEVDGQTLAALIPSLVAASLFVSSQCARCGVVADAPQGCLIANETAAWYAAMEAQGWTQLCPTCAAK